MRHLILLRHAHAEPASTGQADFDRPLSPRGLAEAEAAGAWLAEQSLLPDRVLCSPARRTRETLECVFDRIGYTEMRLEETIYEATPGTLAALLESEGLAGRRIAVEVNGEIVPRGRHGEHMLHEGDRIEIVHALGGG